MDIADVAHVGQCGHQDVNQYGKGKHGFYVCHTCRQEVGYQVAKKAWESDGPQRKGELSDVDLVSLAAYAAGELLRLKGAR